jgi:hypothetical protein
MNNYTYEEKLEFNIIIRTDENGIISSIPININNSDYQQYLIWLEEQNG